MTFNVQFSGAREPTLDAIAAGDADLVLLQEVTSAWERALRQRSASAYPHVAFHAMHGGGGLGVLSRLPLRDVRVLPAVHWFPAQHFFVDTPLGDVQVLHLHLHPMLDGGDPVRGYFTTPPRRRREIETYAPALVPDVPAIIAGDLNEEPGGAAFAHLDALGFRRVDTGATPTWEFKGNWQGNNVAFGLRLDHILLSPALAATSAAVVLAGASDHRPVVATIARADEIANTARASARGQGA